MGFSVVVYVWCMVWWVTHRCHFWCACVQWLMNVWSALIPQEGIQGLFVGQTVTWIVRFYLTAAGVMGAFSACLLVGCCWNVILGSAIARRQYDGARLPAME